MVVLGRPGAFVLPEKVTLPYVAGPSVSAYAIGAIAKRLTHATAHKILDRIISPIVVPECARNA
jgi:hypothetical protein